MPTVHRPRAGSLQYWPRKRAKRVYARVRSWFGSKTPSLLGFAGYKAGMTHVIVKDNRANSLTKNDNIVWPVTVIECPAIKLLSLKFYKNSGPYGSQVASEIFVANKFDKSLTRKLKLPKNYDADKKLKGLKLEEYNDVRGIFFTQPRLTGAGKKKPEVFEIGVGGAEVKSKVEFLKGLIGKEVRVSDVMKQQKVVDVHSITKGKGFQGVVKRMGVTLKSHKSEKGQRRAVVAPEGYAKVAYTAPMGGQVGNHTRTEYNKELLLIGDKPEKVNPKGGFLHYGLVKNDFILIKGSVPGTTKRLIKFTEPIRGRISASNVDVQDISLRSKQ